MINPLNNEWITTEDDRLCPLCRSQGSIWNHLVDEATAAIQAPLEPEPVLTEDQKSDAIEKMVEKSDKGGILKDFDIKTGAPENTFAAPVEQRVTADIATKVPDAFRTEIVPTGLTFGQVATEQQLLASPTLRQAANMIKPIFVGVDIAVGDAAKVVYKAGKYYVQEISGNTKFITGSLSQAALRFNNLEK